MPHVTLKSIANNPDIKEGMTREEIDAAIARHADTETALRPAVRGQEAHPRDRARSRSRACRRTASLATDEERPRERSSEGQRDVGRGQFEAMILDNLRKAGVQNTMKNERLVFDRLEPLAGAVDPGDGRVHRRGRQSRGAWPCRIGPEHGTVGPEQVKEAAKEAVRASASTCSSSAASRSTRTCPEEAKRYGKLTVLAARMNPDLAMGDELLKKTGAGNLFMVFGEPDVDDRATTRTATSSSRSSGVDVYDPTTGADPQQLDRRHRLLVHRHGLQRRELLRPPRLLHRRRRAYEKLKRALRAEIDEAAWSTLYSTDQPAVRAAGDRQDRGQGHQPLRRRGAEGLRYLNLELRT